MWFKQQEQSSNLQRGRDLYHKQLKRLTTNISDTDVAEMMGIAKTEDLFTALGDGSISVNQVVQKLSCKEKEDVVEIEEATPLPKALPSSAVEVLGVGDLLMSMARCCHPIHGDEIIGYITRSRGVTIHRRNCPNILQESEKERLVQVDWGNTQTLYHARIQVKAWDRVGLLGDITSLLSEERVNIASCVSEEFDETSVITLALHVSGIDQLSRLFIRLEGVKSVQYVTRTSS